MLHALLARTLHRAIDAIIDASTLADDSQLEIWQALDKHLVEFQIRGFPSVRLMFGIKHIQILQIGNYPLKQLDADSDSDAATEAPSKQSSADLIVSTDLATLRRLAETGYAPPGKLKMNGDIALAQQLQQLIKTVDIDWVGMLSPITGDDMAYLIGHYGQKNSTELYQLSQRKAESLIEFALYEKQWLVTLAEFRQHKAQNECLTDAIARADFRLKKLNQRLNTHTQAQKQVSNHA